jgi:hypothetical protein
MATLTQVRDALATTLEGIDDLRAYAFPPGQIAVSPTGAAAVITPSNGEFLTYLTSQVSHDLLLTITVFVQRGQDRASTERLDAYIAAAGAHSILLTVKNDHTLGGVVSSCIITGASNHGIATYGAQEMQYLAVEFDAEILL